MRPAFPASEYYGGSVPPAPFGRRRAYPPRAAPERAAGTERTRVVPTFTVIRSTG